MQHTVSDEVEGFGKVSAQVKITRARTGEVEFVDVPMEGIEVYELPDGSISSTYPAGFRPEVIPEPKRRVPLRYRLGLWLVGKGGPLGLALLMIASVMLAAIVYTDAGQAHVIDVLDPGTRGAQTTTYYGAWGATATAPAVGNTALGSEHPEAHVATTISQPAANTIQWLWEVTASAPRTVNEFGVLTASSAGTLVIRGTLSTLNIETGDKAEFTVQLLQKDVSE